MKGSKRKGRRPGTWELRVDAGPDPLTRKRQQKSVIFVGTSRDADVALADLITTASRGQVSVGTRTVADPIEAGLHQAEIEGLEPTTMRGYRTAANNHVLPALGSKRLTHLTAEHLDRFYGALVEAGYSRSTVRGCHVLLCRVLDQAQRWGWVAVNVGRAARPPRQHGSEPEARPGRDDVGDGRAGDGSMTSSCDETAAVRFGRDRPRNIRRPCGGEVHVLTELDWAAAENAHE